MTTRNLSPQQMFIDLARAHIPTHRFTGETLPAFQAWKATTLPKVLATLGDWSTASHRVPGFTLRTIWVFYPFYFCTHSSPLKFRQ